MKGVIICAGKSSRLYPATQRLSKQLLPLYDKPLIYYPISMLMEAGIKDIIIVTNKENQALFADQLGDGSEWGVKFTILVDEKPQGTTGSFLVAKPYIEGEKVCLILGDNFFYGEDFINKFKDCVMNAKGAYCFGYPVKNPTAFGVANIDKQGNITKLVEKPKNPESKWAVTGIYIYDEECVPLAEKVEMSPRGELEITDLNNFYLAQEKLKLVCLSKKNYWLDAGTADGLLWASNYVKKIQDKTKKQVACLEEIAYNNGYIDKAQLKKCYEKVKKSEYGKYLEKYLG
ncbi:MAG: NTP transferase domain-containing protein [Clostridia bacterium]|nr:NTP transferase domain-containing protein [Clostridia bacterium]